MYAIFLHFISFNLEFIGLIFKIDRKQQRWLIGRRRASKKDITVLKEKRQGRFYLRHRQLYAHEKKKFQLKPSPQTIDNKDTGLDRYTNIEMLRASTCYM